MRGRTQSRRRGSCTSGRTHTVHGPDVRPRPPTQLPRAMRSRPHRSRPWIRRCDSAVRGGYRPGPAVPSRTSLVAPAPGTRRLPSSGVLQDTFRAGCHGVPNCERLRQRGPTAVREPVILPRHAAPRLLPPALDELALLEPPKRGVQGPLLEIEEAVRLVAELVEDLEPILLLLREEGEEAELDRAFLQLRGPLRRDFGHPVGLVSGPRYIGFRSEAARSVSARIRT